MKHHDSTSEKHGEFYVRYGAHNYRVRKYGRGDEHEILDQLFSWKVTALIHKFTGIKKPQMPGTFSERFVCYVCGLAHNTEGSGPDAFLLNLQGNVESAIEIKATTTEGGFNDVKRALQFDELYWLSFVDFDSLKYEIYHISKHRIESFVEASGTKHDRATVNLKRITKENRLGPAHKGRIGIVREKP